jgi:hypothetical protein
MERRQNFNIIRKFNAPQSLMAARHLAFHETCVYQLCLGIIASGIGIVQKEVKYFADCLYYVSLKEYVLRFPLISILVS